MMTDVSRPGDPTPGFEMTLEQAHQIVAWAISHNTQFPPTILKQFSLIHCLREYGYQELVETGTFVGDTSAFVSERGYRVYTIELSRALYCQAIERFAGNDRVTCLHGDSARVLPKVIERLSGPALFWLDGHHSGGSTARGKMETPIEGELRCLVRARIERPDFIDRCSVFIDDIRDFGSGEYPTVAAVIDFIRENLPRHRYAIVNDALRIVPGSIV